MSITMRADLALSPNRAEELGYDVWNEFVLPSFFDAADLKFLKKPRVIIGGRGCGKTMLLRYLSHQSAFSPRRASVPLDELDHVGLYWRVDTQFAGMLTSRGVDDDVWHAAFQHLTALMLALEMCASIQTMQSSTLKPFTITDVSNIDLSRLKAFDPTLPTEFEMFRDELQARLWAFETWANNVRTIPAPVFFPGRAFVLALAGLLKASLPVLHATTFFIYIDEYENLLEYQQELVNTWLKHSEPPLVFNVAMKRNAFRTRATTGSESLSEIHDFRRFDLEDLERRFDVFAAEVLFMKLAGTQFAAPVDISILRDPAHVRARREPKYIETVVSAARRLLPQKSYDEIAADVFEDKALLRRLLERISHALTIRKSNLATESFMIGSVAAASIVVPALLYRRGLTPTVILEQLRACARGAPSKFTGTTGWIHNNLVAALLQLYEPLSRACPVYAGFDRFTALAKNNVRHFLELAHKALSRALADDSDATCVSVTNQAEAARHASAALLAEVKSFGILGNQLYTFTLRLGSVFALAHQRPALSENEQNHFAIIRGAMELDGDARALLLEATKWSVLFEERGTKTKKDTDPESVEYVLNPIYAPHFHISYRKKRRLELRSEEVLTMMRGSYDDMKALLGGFAERWSIDEAPLTQSLFSGLFAE